MIYLLSSLELFLIGIIYSDQNVCARVSWNGQFSNKFSVSNGVRQGGVLSPILFTVYIDDLLTELEKKRCWLSLAAIVFLLWFGAQFESLAQARRSYILSCNLSDTDDIVRVKKFRSCSQS